MIEKLDFDRDEYHGNDEDAGDPIWSNIAFEDEGTKIKVHGDMPQVMNRAGVRMMRKWLDDWLKAHKGDA